MAESISSSSAMNEVSVDATDVDESIDMQQHSDHPMSDSEEEVEPGDGGSADDGDAGERNDPAADRMDEEFADDSIQGFFQHTESIYCVAISPTDSDLCATGGGDDIAYLWNITSASQVARLDGHTDSVTAVQFSFDGKFLATAGMDGLLQIWSLENLDASQCKPIVVLEAGSEILWMEFHPRGQVLIAGTSDGTVWMWSVPSGAVLGVFAGHTASSTSGCWANDGKSFASVSEDGTIIQWNPKTIQPEHRIETAHDERRSGGEMGWNVIALDPTGKICTVGSPEGRVKVINIASGNLLASLDEQTDSIEAIVYAGTGNLLAIASVDGSIALYEVPSMKLRSILHHEDAVIGLQFESNSNELFSCSVDRTIRKWDARSSQQLQIWRGHQEPIMCMAVQKGGKKVVSCGDDKVALVFEA